MISRIPPHVRWTAAIIGLLGSSVLVYGIAVVVAISDPSFAVEPGYEETAANWDDEMAQRAASDRLGWTVRVSTEDAKWSSERTVVVRLRDDAGAPIEGARVAFECFHNARAAQRRALTATERAPGDYVATVGMDRSGTWIFEIEAVRGDERFTAVQRRTIALSSGRAP